MLTFLSQKIRRLLNAAAPGEDASRPAGAADPAGVAGTSAIAGRPALRLVRAGDAAAPGHDISIRVAAGSSVGASAFVAGAGARLYSLDVFRQARLRGRPGPHSPAHAA